MSRNNAQQPALSLWRGASLREAPAGGFAHWRTGEPSQCIYGSENGPVEDGDIDTSHASGWLYLPISQVCDGGAKPTSRLMNPMYTVYPHWKGEYRVIF